jgi:hypothetical protein|tara:strand:+ start:251 stop:577 length:327 start_codon:yes stop_codon:yes gene_type:complete
MIYKFLFFIFLLFVNSVLYAESDIDQWEDSAKTYKDLIDEGFEVKTYDTSTLKTESGLILMFFVTVLQKNREVYECQEYQTVDETLQTLDLSFICRKLVQPYKIGIGT